MRHRGFRGLTVSMVVKQVSESRTSRCPHFCLMLPSHAGTTSVTTTLLGFNIPLWMYSIIQFDLIQRL